MMLGHVPELVILLVLVIIFFLIPFFCIRYFVRLHARTTAQEFERSRSERSTE